MTKKLIRTYKNASKLFRSVIQKTKNKPCQKRKGVKS